MSEQAKHYGSLALALAAALGVASGLALAAFAPTSPKTAQGG